MFFKIFVLILFNFFLGFSFAQGNLNIINQTIKKYENASSISYNITYSIKTFNRSSPIIEYGSVKIKKKPLDSIFGSQFIYTYHYEDAEKGKISPKVIKTYIDSFNLYVIEPSENLITRFNPSKDEVFPVTGRFDGELINIYYPNIHKLKKEIKNELNSIVYSDSLNFLKISINFPDEGEFNNEEKTIYINKNSKFIEKIKYQVQYKNQVQFNVWDLSNINFENLEDNYFVQKIKQYSSKYELEDYVSPPKSYYNLLNKEKTAPFLEGYFYPDYFEKLDIHFNKITVLDFWYIACLPCIKTIPQLNRLKKKYKDQIEIIGVNPIENKKADKVKIDAFLNRTPIDYKILLVDSIPKEYNIIAYPTLYVLGKDGKVKYSYSGYKTELYKELDSVVKSLKTNDND